MRHSQLNVSKNTTRAKLLTLILKVWNGNFSSIWEPDKNAEYWVPPQDLLKQKHWGCGPAFWNFNMLSWWSWWDLKWDSLYQDKASQLWLHIEITWELNKGLTPESHPRKPDLIMQPRWRTTARIKSAPQYHPCSFSSSGRNHHLLICNNSLPPLEGRASRGKLCTKYRKPGGLEKGRNHLLPILCLLNSLSSLNKCPDLSS